MRVSSEAVRSRGLGSGEPMIIIKQELSFRQSVRNLPGATELGGDGQLSQTRTRDVIQRPRASVVQDVSIGKKVLP
jgi:hypothetical protein